MSFRTGLLAIADAVRRIPGDLDLRPYTLTLRVRTWDGARVGMGNSTDVDTVLTVGTGGQPAKVKEMSSRDVLASGGKYSDGDIKVGPFTPEYPGGGLALADIDPPVGTSPTEVLYRIDGPTYDNVWCTKVDVDDMKNFSRFLVLRRTNVTP